MSKLFFHTVGIAVLTVFLLSCGGAQTAIKVGETEMDRDSWFDWVELRTGYEDDEKIENSILMGLAYEWLQNQALDELLTSYGLIPTSEEVISSKNQLLTAGLSESDPRIDTFSKWQAVRNLASDNENQELGKIYEDHIEIFSHDLCTSHILTDTQEEAFEMIELFESGEDFESLAITFSSDRGSGDQGGSLGCVPIGAFVGEYERAVLGGLEASTRVNNLGLLGPVESAFGFHLIRIDRIAPVEARPFNFLGDRTFPTILQIATITSEIEVDKRYGYWDQVIGQLIPLRASES